MSLHLSIWLCLPRARRDYWEQILPSSGRPLCASLSTPAGWGVTKGHADLLQHKEATSAQEMKHVVEKLQKAKWEREREECLSWCGERKEEEGTEEGHRGGSFPIQFINNKHLLQLVLLLRADHVCLCPEINKLSLMPHFTASCFQCGVSLIIYIQNMYTKSN